MRIDKALYKNAWAYYRQWNEAELIARIRQGCKLTPKEGWQQYVALTEFLWKSNPQPTRQQQKQKIETLNR